MKYWQSSASQGQQPKDQNHTEHSVLAMRKELHNILMPRRAGTYMYMYVHVRTSVKGIVPLDGCELGLELTVCPLRIHICILLYPHEAVNVTQPGSISVH